MNLPNKLTIIRLILIIPFMLLFHASYAIPLFGATFTIFKIILTILTFIVFVLASFTDYIDGYIARRDNLVTDFGKLADPIADKLLIISALLIILSNGEISTLIVFLMIGREIVITALRALVSSKGGEIISASKLGKYKTVAQIIGISIIIIVPNTYITNSIIMIPALVLSLASAYDYYKNAKEYLSTEL